MGAICSQLLRVPVPVSLSTPRRSLCRTVAGDFACKVLYVLLVHLSVSMGKSALLVLQVSAPGRFYITTSTGV